jgi:hypothetical protein
MSFLRQSHAAAEKWVAHSLAAALAITAGIPGAVPAGVLSGPHFRAGSDHAHFLVQADGWLESEAEAGVLGGHLATVNDAAKQHWLQDTFGALDGFPQPPDRNVARG